MFRVAHSSSPDWLVRTTEAPPTDHEAHQRPAVADFSAVIGSPRKECLQRGGRCSNLLDDEGKLAGKSDKSSSRSLAHIPTAMEGTEKDLFIALMRKMVD